MWACLTTAWWCLYLPSLLWSQRLVSLCILDAILNSYKQAGGLLLLLLTRNTNFHFTTIVWYAYSRQIIEKSLWHQINISMYENWFIFTSLHYVRTAPSPQFLSQTVVNASSTNTHALNSIEDEISIYRKKDELRLTKSQQTESLYTGLGVSERTAALSLSSQPTLRLQMTLTLTIVPSSYNNSSKMSWTEDNGKWGEIWNDN